MLKLQETETWGDLLKALQQATTEQLSQPIQVVKGHPVDEYVYPMLPGICIGTVDELGLRYARSCEDNRRHGEHLVIYVDAHPFGKDATIGYDGLFDDNTPIYSKNKTPDQDWTGPAQKIADAQERPEGKGTLGAVLKHRLDKDPLLGGGE